LYDRATVTLAVSDNAPILSVRDLVVVGAKNAAADGGPGKKKAKGAGSGK